MRTEIKITIPLDPVPTAEAIAEWANDCQGMRNIQRINKVYRALDSRFPLIKGKHSVTQRAIDRVRSWRRRTPLYGLEYTRALEKEINDIAAGKAVRYKRRDPTWK